MGSPMMHPPGIDPEEYWTVEVVGSAIEWLYVLRKIVESLGDRHDDGQVIMMVYDHASVWYLKKKYVPAALLAAKLGFTEQQVNEAPKISLTVKMKPDLPNPTVTYYGTA